MRVLGMLGSHTATALVGNHDASHCLLNALLLSIRAALRE
jgi:hypothetical protein